MLKSESGLNIWNNILLLEKYSMSLGYKIIGIHVKIGISVI